jgi:ribosomal protein S18 acetylase RimI-like enzyme
LEVLVPNVRKAHGCDAKKLSELAEATFKATFGALNTAEHMELHCQTSYGEQIQAAEIADPGMVTLVSEDKGRLIAYAQLRWGEAPDCVSAQSPGEIQRLYVVEDWHGKGVAQELMKACISEIKEIGSDALWLGVWERNPRAIAFYKKFGFVEAGEHTFPLGGDPQRDIVMARSVASEQST